jgi:glycosyltransferase involved in cell wall biosynthesis
VDRYIAPSEFVREKFERGGLPPEKLTCKPHFVPLDPGSGDHRGGYGLFVGRLSEEKGIRILLEASTNFATAVPIKVVGDGPLAPLLREPPSHVDWLGQRTKTEVLHLMKDASFLIFPSECYETFGLTIVEAFATGLPVIASDSGAAVELVTHGRTGLHFRTGDSADLAAKMRWSADHPQQLAALGRAARQDYQELYTAERNYQLLMDVYRGVISGDRHPDRLDAVAL